MYNEKEFLEFYEKQKACFEKEINETEKMLKEVVGEEKDGFYRISQMLRLIQYDYNELLECVGEVAESVSEVKNQIETLKWSEDEIIQRLHMTAEEYSKNYDIVSEIVKRANRLDETCQRMALSFITGMVSAFEDNKLKRKNKKFM